MSRRLLDVASFLAGAALAAGLVAGAVIASPLRRFVG